MALLAAYAVVFIANLAPAFMPPSWAVLTFFYLEFDLPLLPLTLGGALAAGLGRAGLARGSHRLGPWLTRGHADDVAALHDYLGRRDRGVFWGTFLYAIGPLPTNNLFIAGGVVGVRLTSMLGGFWAARAIADTFWVWVTARAVGRVHGVFTPSQHGWLAIAAQLVGLALALALLRLPWHRWLLRRMDGRGRPPA